MRRGKRLLTLNSVFTLVAVLLAGLGLSACGGTSPEEEKAALLAEEWAWLQQAKSDLDGKRAELAELRKQIADYVPADETAAAEGEGTEAEASPTEEELAAQAEAMQQEVYSLADGYGPRLTQFINDQGISVGSELTDVQRQAFGMKSDEDIVLAQEYINKGGEYGRAIEIYKQSLISDPDNEKLLAAKALAEERRYMTEERLDQVKKDMTESEVRELLGTPKGSNVREYDQGAIGWFYPKEEPHTAAAVFFRPKKDVLRVYKTDFEAVKSAQG